VSFTEKHVSIHLLNKKRLTHNKQQTREIKSEQEHFQLVFGTLQVERVAILKNKSYQAIGKA
jgi:hypothetical protein